MCLAADLLHCDRKHADQVGPFEDHLTTVVYTGAGDGLDARGVKSPHHLPRRSLEATSDIPPEDIPLLKCVQIGDVDPSHPAAVLKGFVRWQETHADPVVRNLLLDGQDVCHVLDSQPGAFGSLCVTI